MNEAYESAKNELEITVLFLVQISYILYVNVKVIGDQASYVSTDTNRVVDVNTIPLIIIGPCNRAGVILPS